MDAAAADTLDLMHCLGFLYLRHGQPYRAVVILLVAAHVASERPDVLRTLCAALVAARMGTQALELLDRLAQLDPGSAQHPMIRLLRARALLLLGRRDAARAAFRAPPPGSPPESPPESPPKLPQGPALAEVA